MASKLHLSLSSGIYCTELFQKIEQFQIDSGIIDEIEYIMLLLNSNSQTERLTFSVCKSKKRNLSLASQLTKNIEDTDNDATVDDKSFSQNYIYLNIMFQRIKNYTNILMKTFPNSHQKNNDFFIFNELHDYERAVDTLNKYDKYPESSVVEKPNNYSPIVIYVFDNELKPFKIHFQLSGVFESPTVNFSEDSEENKYENEAREIIW